MINILLLLGPTVMIFLGLQVMDSVPLTFALFYSWLLFLPIIYLRRAKLSINKSLEFIGLKINKRALLYGGYSGILCLVAIFGCVLVLQDFFFNIPYLKVLLKKWGFSGKFVVELVLVLLFINPFLEEIYWRGFMFTRLKIKYGAYSANLITAFFYALYHLLSIMPMFKWPFNIISVIPVFLAGILWGYLRIKFNSLAGSITSHILADAGIMLVYVKFLT